MSEMQFIKKFTSIYILPRDQLEKKINTHFGTRLDSLIYVHIRAFYIIFFELN